VLDIVFPTLKRELLPPGPPKANRGAQPGAPLQ
jgi:hypothetical protein